MIIWTTRDGLKFLSPLDESKIDAYRYGWSHSVVDCMFVEAFGALTLALKQSLSHARSDHN